MGDDLNELRAGPTPGQGSQVGSGPTAARCVQRDTAVDLPSAVSEVRGRAGVLDVTPTAVGLVSNVNGFGRREAYTERKRARSARRENVEGDSGDALFYVILFVALLFFVVVGVFAWKNLQNDSKLAEANPEAYERMRERQLDVAETEIVTDGLLSLFGK